MKPTKTIATPCARVFLTLAAIASVSPLVGKQASTTDTPPNTGAKTTYLAINKEDFELALKSKFQTDSYFIKNAELLNDSSPDEYGFFKQTLDVEFEGGWGEQQHGERVINVDAQLRQKAIWGDSGKDGSTTSEEIKLDTGVVTGGHSHKSTKLNIWLRQAWIEANLNKIFNNKNKQQQYLKIGMFPVVLGRGIAFGPLYGSAKNHLGIFSGYQSDQFNPAINLHGNIIQDRLLYDLYFIKLEEKSGSFSDVFKATRATHVGKEANPFRGPAKDNEVLAGRLKWDVFSQEDTKTLNLEPYILYNEASGQKVEIEEDAKGELWTAGLGVEFKRSNFEWGCEGAFNFGQQTVYNIDRNTTSETIDDSTGQVIVKYSHVRVGSASGDKAPVTSANKTAVNANTITTNSEKISSAGGGLYNAANRFRPRYVNEYRGWMFTTDASYELKKADLKFAGTYAVASGDGDPNVDEESKKYYGFVGLQEIYSGKRVPSVLVLDSRKLIRPLTLRPDEEKGAGADPSFTDMHYIGAGVTWTPIKHDPKKFFINSNVLTYWKYQQSFKYLFDDNNDQASTTDKASRHLGTEVNMRVQYEALDGLNVFGNLAMFIPGNYYKDVKGTKLRSDVSSKINLPNPDTATVGNYRLSDDISYFVNVGINYKF